MLNTKEFPDKAGRIFPPVIAIEYGEVTLKDLEEGKKMDFEFSVSYSMELREARKDIEVNIYKCVHYAKQLSKRYSQISNKIF